MWIVKEDFNDIAIDCLTPPTCPFDGTGLRLLTSKLLNFDLEPGSGKKDAHAIDMECRCQRCGWWDAFGVPLHKRQYDKLHDILCMSGHEQASSDVGYITGMMINPDALGSSMEECWERTNDLKGHKPKFSIVCYHCGVNGRHVNMFFRYAYIGEKKNELTEVYSKLNQMEYKCKHCEWTTKFLVESDEEYLNHVKDAREKAGFHRNLYYLPPDEWAEDEEIAKKLHDLGYW